jgi:hypothetical protein
MSKEEFDRLMETSPNIPEKILTQFKDNFNKEAVFDKIVKPEVCDILIPTNDYRNPWYNEENRAKAINDNMRIRLANDNKQKKQVEINTKIVTDFVELFRNLNNREPMETEIFDNLKDKIDLTTIKKILDEGNIINLVVSTNLDDGSIV